MTKQLPNAYGANLSNEQPSAVLDRLHGFRVGRADDGVYAINLQYDIDGVRQSVAVPTLEALALLSMLKSWQLNEDLPFPDDPRDPNWRAADYVAKNK